MDSLRTIALIPAYEPRAALLELLEQLNAEGFSCIVIDDGSGDAFAEIFEHAAQDATVLSHPVNRGKGRALKTGLAYLEEQSLCDCTVVTLDADGQHTLADAVTVCNAAKNHPDALVLGSRALKEHVPLRSRLGNSVTRWVYRMSTGLSIHDTQTGLRAFNGSLIPLMAQIPGERYEYEMNVLLELARRKQPILEVEIATIYLAGNSGSHFDAMRDSCRIYREILKFSGSSLISFFIDYSLYALLSALTVNAGAFGLTFSNICARIVSASVNYTINRRLVFQSSTGVFHSAIRYFALALFILAGNTWLLNFLVATAGINRYFAKLTAEIVFFFLSWSMQHVFVFERFHAQDKERGVDK